MNSKQILVIFACLAELVCVVSGSECASHRCDQEQPEGYTVSDGKKWYEQEEHDVFKYFEYEKSLLSFNLRISRPQAALRVATYNLGRYVGGLYEDNVKHILKDFGEIEADVLLIQGASLGKRKHKKLLRGLDDMGYKHRIISGFDGHKSMIVSKENRPIESSYRLTASPNRLLCARILIGGQDILICNINLPSCDPSASLFMELLEEANHKPSHYIIGGSIYSGRDANPFSQIVKSHGEIRLTDVFAKLGIQHPSYTGITGAETDFIFTSKMLRPMNAFVLHTLNLHFTPIITDLTIDLGFEGKDVPESTEAKAPKGCLDSEEKNVPESVEAKRPKKSEPDVQAQEAKSDDTD